MAAFSLHLGLNRVDATHYQGWTGALTACECDARDMANIATRQGYVATVLLTAQATSGQLLQWLSLQAAQRRSGESVLLSFAGHGSQVLDRNGDEPDRLDETWVLYDRMVLDDEIQAQLTRFMPGVRVTIVVDSCHSGTSARLMNADAGFRQARFLDRTLAEAVVRSHGWTYGGARASVPRAEAAVMRCRTLVLAACQDSQLAMDGPANGLFTDRLKQVWSGGRFTGSYIDFGRRIRERMPGHQQPHLSGMGEDVRSLALERPFEPRAAAVPTPPPLRMVASS